MKLRVAFFLLLVCLSVVVFSCRRNQPSLVDSNRPPDTELWYAPLDSTEYAWNVHLYWRGVDNDGIAGRFIWTITDTLEANPLLRWNPSERISDFRLGRVTARTDSVIAFTAFTNVAGVGLRKNRQAFHVAQPPGQFGLIPEAPRSIHGLGRGGMTRTVHGTTVSERRDRGQGGCERGFKV